MSGKDAATVIADLLRQMHELTVLHKQATTRPTSMEVTGMSLERRESIIGSRPEVWNTPHPTSLRSATFSP